MSTEPAAPEPSTPPMPALGLRDLVRYLYARGVVSYQVPSTIAPEQLVGDVESTLLQITLDDAAASLGMAPTELAAAAARWCAENPAPVVHQIRTAEEAERLFGKGTKAAALAREAFHQHRQGAFQQPAPAPSTPPPAAPDLHPARLEVAANLRAIAAGVVGLGSAVGFARRWALRHGVTRVASGLEAAVNRTADVTESLVGRAIVRPVVDVTMRLAAWCDQSPEPIDAQREAVLAGVHGPRKGDVPPVVRLG